MRYFNKNDSERYYAKFNNCKSVKILTVNTKDKFFMIDENQSINIIDILTNYDDYENNKIAIKEVSFDVFILLKKFVLESNYKRVYAETSIANHPLRATQEQVLKAINMECSSKEITRLAECIEKDRNTYYEKTIEYYNYYDKDTILSGLKKKLNGEITDEYFNAWVKLYYVALHCGEGLENEEANKILYLIENQFEFYEDNKISDWDYSLIKYFCLKIEELKNKNENCFSNNGVYIYLKNEFVFDNIERYCALIVNKKTKKYNYFYIDNPTFNINLNYNFCIDIQYEFDDLCCSDIEPRDFFNEYLSKYKKDEKYHIDNKISL